MTKEFWIDWKRKTKIEEAAIKSLKAAKKIILKNIPKSEIIAIYIKGSFVRRELNKKSDIDTVSILKTNKYKEKMEFLEKKYRYNYKPDIELGSLSLWELENNKHFIKTERPRALPDRFLAKIKDYKLIYGKPIEIKKFLVRTDKKNFNDLINAFKKDFFPLYKKRKMGFSQIIKETFWLTDLEQRVKGKNAKHSFRGIAHSIKDKRHIIHDALRLRLKPTKDKNIRKRFMTKLKKHLKKLRS